MSETVKLIVTLSKGQYEALEDIKFGSIASRMIFNAVKHGTPLPKGHGRLIDDDSLIKAIEEKAKRLSNADTINGLCGAVALIFDAPTIVEADKGD